MLPFLNQFLEHMEPNEEDPTWLTSFKSELKRETEERCHKNLDHTLLGKCSFFDKRFTTLNCIKDTYTREVIKTEIKAEAKELEREKAKETSEEKTSEPGGKKKRFLGKGLADSPQKAEKGAEYEMRRFQQVKISILLHLPLWSTGSANSRPQPYFLPGAWPGL